MRIYGPNGTTLGSPASGTRRTSSSGFSLPMDDAAATSETRATTAPKATANIDALLALQGIEEDPAERRRRSAGSSSMPCRASSASMLAVALGAVVARVSDVAAASSIGREKPLELVRRVPLAGEPSVVPFGP